MLFGDPQVFAVQVDLTDHSPWLNGHIFYWIAGEQFGDPQEPVAVAGAISNLITIVKDGGRRGDDALRAMPDAEAFDYLYRHQYGEAPLEELEMAARFEISMKFPLFGDRLLYAVEVDIDRYRLLMGSHDAGLERTAYCPVVTLEDAFFDAYMYVNSFNKDAIP